MPRDRRIRQRGWLNFLATRLEARPSRAAPVRAHLRDRPWQLSISGVTLHRKDHQPVALDPVDKTVLVAETHRPEPGQVPTQRFWLVQPRERFLDQISDDFDDAVQEPRLFLRQEHELPARLPGEVRSQDRRCHDLRLVRDQLLQRPGRNLFQLLEVAGALDARHGTRN